MGRGSLLTVRAQVGGWSVGLLTEDAAAAQRFAADRSLVPPDLPAVFTAIVLTGPAEAEVLRRLKHAPDGSGRDAYERAVLARMTRDERASLAALDPGERDRLLLEAPLIVEAPAERLVAVLHPDGAGTPPAALLAPLAAFLPLGASAVPLVALSRGGREESVHAGTIAVSDGAARLLACCGDADAPVFMRSAAKPFQAVPLVERGALEAHGWGDEELALACGSHAGAPEHLAVARRMLGRLGLPESAVACGLAFNCSGKHLGFLAAALRAGEPAAGYLDPAHPVQRRVAGVLAAAAGASPAAVAADGCGAPTFALAPRAIAAAFARLADPAAAPEALGKPLERIGAAMAAAPGMVGGEGRFETALTRATRGRILAKPGAEGVLGLAVRGEALGFAVKMQAGNGGAPLAAVAMEALAQWDLLAAAELAALAAWRRPPVRNVSGAEVGATEPLFSLR